MGERNTYSDALVKRNPWKHKAAEMATRYCAKDLRVHTAENLDSVRELLIRGEYCMGVGNHLSDSDGPIIDLGFKTKGYVDLAAKLDFFLGIRLEKRRYGKRTLNSYNYFRVWPPTEIPEDKEQEREALRMNLKAARGAKAAMLRGEIPFLFAEGTRSATQAIGEVDHRIAIYWHLLSKMNIVPVGSFGTEIVWPRGRGLPRRAAGANLVIGRPVALDPLKSLYEHLGRNEMNHRITNHIMGEIALLLPESYRGHYREVSSEGLV